MLNLCYVCVRYKIHLWSKQVILGPFWVKTVILDQFCVKKRLFRLFSAIFKTFRNIFAKPTCTHPHSVRIHQPPTQTTKPRPKLDLAKLSYKIPKHDSQSSEVHTFSETTPKQRFVNNQLVLDNGEAKTIKSNNWATTFGP